MPLPYDASQDAVAWEESWYDSEQSLGGTPSQASGRGRSATSYAHVGAHDSARVDVESDVAPAAAASSVQRGGQARVEAQPPGRVRT